MEFFPEVTTPFRELHFVRNPFRALEGMFTETMKPWLSTPQFNVPVIPVDVLEQPERYVVQANLPGIDRESIDIAFENSTLTLRVEVDREQEKKDEFYLTRERLFTTTVRSITLPLADSKGTIDARMKDGVLSIAVPKRPEKQSRKIEIH